MAALEFLITDLESWPPEKQFYTIIDSYLQPGSSASTQDTAKQIHALRLDVLPETEVLTEETEDLRSFMRGFWGLFAETAREIPYDHPSQQRMLDLALALRELKTPQGKTWYGPGYVLDDELRSCHFDPRSTDPEEVTGKFHTTNLWVFAARLTGANPPYGDFSYIGMYAMQSALEDIPDPRAKAWHTHGPVLDAWVLIAAEWIQLAGKIILQRCRDDVEISSRAWPNDKRGRKGFFVERWRFWKDAFGRVSEMELTSTSTRSMAEAARARMIELEDVE